MLEKKQNKTPPLSSLGLFWISLQREIRDALKLRMWQRTETKLLTAGLCDGCSVISGPRRCAEPCPAGCLKVTPTRPCWETNSVCLFAGCLCWGHSSLGLCLLYSYSCPTVSTHQPLASAPEPLLVNFQLNYFWTVLLFAVFSSKFVIKGLTWHRKCSCGLIPVQSNWIWARKKLLTHFRGEASVFVSLPPSGRVKAEWPLWLSSSHRTTQDSEENGFCGALAMRHFFLCKPHSPQHREGGIITPVLQMWLREEKNISMGKWVAPWHLLFQPLCLKKCVLWRRIRCYSILFCVFRKNPFLSRLPFMLL